VRACLKRGFFLAGCAPAPAAAAPAQAPTAAGNAHTQSETVREALCCKSGRAWRVPNARQQKRCAVGRFVATHRRLRRLRLVARPLDGSAEAWVAERQGALGPFQPETCRRRIPQNLVRQVLGEGIDPFRMKR
jgi:hypothetical protein